MAIHVDRELLIEELPRECIDACSASGAVDGAVAYWREALGFTVNRANAIEAIAQYGAWERDDLASRDDVDLAEIVLWLAAGDFSEYITEAEDAGVDPYNRPSVDVFEPNCGTDVFTIS